MNQERWLGVRIGLYIADILIAGVLALKSFVTGEILRGLCWTAVTAIYGGILAYIARK